MPSEYLTHNSQNEIVSNESVVDNDYWCVIKSALVSRRTIFFVCLNV
jgi:hypothetical protein